VKRSGEGGGQVGVVVGEEGVNDCCDMVEIELFSGCSCGHFLNEWRGFFGMQVVVVRCCCFEELKRRLVGYG
jgi:hypothetical protein